MEDKKAKSPTKGKTEKAAEKKSLAKKSASAADVTDATGATDAPSAASAADGKTSSDPTVVSAEPVTIPSEWTSHGAIALVSHGALGGITVIHTEVPAGTQIQPIMTTDSTGASVISLDGSSISVPFSIPVSMAQPAPLSSEASLSVPPVLSVPVSEAMLASVTEIPTVSTSSVLEAAVSQTILAPVSDAKTSSEMDILPPSIQTVIVTDRVCGKEATAAAQSDEQERTADSEAKEASEETV